MDNIWTDGPYLQEKAKVLKLNSAADTSCWNQNSLQVSQKFQLSTSLPNLLTEFEEASPSFPSDSNRLCRQMSHQITRRTENSQNRAIYRRKPLIRRQLNSIAPVTKRPRIPIISETCDDCESGYEDSDDVDKDENIPEARRVSEWVVPVDEIKFTKRAAGGKRRSIYRGHWHGKVVVHTFEPLREPNVKDFLKFVTPFSTLRHDNVLLFMGVCMDPQCLAVITSATRGPSLFDVIHVRQEAISLTDKVNIGRQVAQAMNYLHSRNVIHGCLSSRNVFLDNRIKVSLIDYGLVDSRLNRTNHGCLPNGQLTYFSPELIRHLHVTDEATGLSTSTTPPADVFAFGTICYELLTGCWPFQETEPHSIIWQVGRGCVQCLQTIKGPATNLKDLVSTCWEVKSDQRPHFMKIVSVFNHINAAVRRTTN